jgi:hypothetical protein
VGEATGGLRWLREQWLLQVPKWPKEEVAPVGKKNYFHTISLHNIADGSVCDPIREIINTNQ